MIATLIYNTPELIKVFKELNATIIDVSDEPIEGCDIRYEQNLYWVGNWHRFLMETKSKYVWMLNSDIKGATREMYDSLLEWLVNNDGFMITPSFNSPHERFRMFAHPILNEATLESTWIDMACPLINVDKYRELGGFDLAFRGYFADVDLCYRARQKGFKMYIDNRFEVEHIGGYTVQKEAKHEQANIGDNAILLAKYGKNWTELI
jgi:GT2 family glycosyltransferase